VKVRVSNRQRLRRPGLKRIERHCLRILTLLGVDPSAELDVSVVGPEEMRDLNLRYRGVDSTTDVLSFPMQEFSGRGPFRPVKGAHAFPLGDVVVEAERAVEQAGEAVHSVANEYLVLLVHGILHLLGFDHEGDERKRQSMFRKEQEIISAIENG
jgi:probable rRNA maturation factor